MELIPGDLSKHLFGTNIAISSIQPEKELSLMTLNYIERFAFYREPRTRML